jgi:hypothetical protein
VSQAREAEAIKLLVSEESSRKALDLVSRDFDQIEATPWGGLLVLYEHIARRGETQSRSLLFHPQGNGLVEGKNFIHGDPGPRQDALAFQESHQR